MEQLESSPDAAEAGLAQFWPNLGGPCSGHRRSRRRRPRLRRPRPSHGRPSRTCDACTVTLSKHETRSRNARRRKTFRVPVPSVAGVVVVHVCVGSSARIPLASKWKGAQTQAWCGAECRDDTRARYTSLSAHAVFFVCMCLSTPLGREPSEVRGGRASAPSSPSVAGGATSMSSCRGRSPRAPRARESQAHTHTL